MGMKLNCAFPTEADRKYAGIYSRNPKAERTSSQFIAIVRDYYERATGKQVVSTSDYMTAVQFYNQSEEKAKLDKEVDKILSSPLTARKVLNSIFTHKQRESKLKALTNMCIDVLDVLEDKYDTFTRAELIHGVTLPDGRVIGGISYILSNVIRNTGQLMTVDGKDNSLMGIIAQQTARLKEIENVPELKEEYERLKEQRRLNFICLREWSSFVPLIKKNLSALENVKIGLFEEYATPTTIDNTTDSSDILNYYSEESIREGWQELVNSESVASTISIRVKQALRHIPILDKDGNYVRNEFGDIEYMSPTSACKLILESVRGCDNVDEFMEGILYLVNFYRNASNEAANPFISLYETLQDNRNLQTIFYASLHRSFIEYLSIDDRAEYGIKKNYVNLLNKESGTKKFKKFMSTLHSRPQFTKNSIFQKEGKKAVFSEENYVKAIDYLREWFMPSIGEGESEATTSKFSRIWKEVDKTRTTPKAMQVLVLTQALSNLGVLSGDPSKVDVERRAILNVLRDPSSLRVLINRLSNLAQIGTSSDIVSGTSDIETVLKASIQGQDKFLVNTLSGILETLNLSGATGNTTSQVRYAGNVRISDVVPSFLGSYIGSLRRYARKASATNTELKNYLETKYGIRRNAEGVIITRNDALYSIGEDGKTIKFKNFWLNSLYNSGRKQDSLLFHINHQRVLGGATNNDAEDFSPLEKLSTMLALFMNMKERDPRIRKKFGSYPVFIQGDSQAFEFITAEKYAITDIKAKFADIFEQEICRIAQANSIRKHMAGRDISGLNAYIDNITSFSWIKCLEFAKNDKGLLVDKKGKELAFYNEDGIEYTVEELRDNPKLKTLENQLNNFDNVKLAAAISITNTEESETFGNAVTINELLSNREAFVKEIITPFLQEGFTKFLQDARSSGLLRTTKNEKYVYLESYLNKKDDRADQVNQILEEFYYNYKFASIQQSQMFNIDTAFFPNSKDYQKRNKQIHSSGTTLDIDAIDLYCRKDSPEYGKPLFKDGMQRALYYKEIRVNSERTNPEFMKVIVMANLLDQSEEHKAAVREKLDYLVTELDDPIANKARLKALGEEMFKSKNNPEGKGYESYPGFKKYNKFRKNQLTDGQGHRTLKSYRAICISIGNWSKKQERAYRTILEIRKAVQAREKDGGEGITAEERTTIEKCGVILQPLKPQYYGYEEYNISDTEKALIPVQHKCSEAVLIPELMHDGLLKDLAIYMEENDIDVILSSEAVKVGCFGEIDTKDTKNAKELYSLIGQDNIHSLSLAGYKIQNNVSEHLDVKELFGTQARKMFFKSIKLAADYSRYVKGHRVTLENGSVVSLNGTNLIKFYSDLVVALMLDSNDEWERVVSSNKTLSRVLMDAASNSATILEDVMLSLSTDENGEFHTPINEGSIEYQMVSTMVALFKKLDNKQYIRGGTVVHETIFGNKGYEYDSNLHIVVKDGNVIEIESEQPFDFTIVGPDGEEFQLEFDDWCNEDGTLKVDEEGNSLLERAFPGITERLLYRIPTEDSYSLVKTRIVRFSRKTDGAVAKYPPEITTILGLDFDIDKGKYIRKEFKLTRLSQKEIAEVWEDFYETYPEIKEALKGARELFGFNADTTESIVNFILFGPKGRLYQYWKEAGLEGTATKAFRTHLLTKMYEKVKFEEYDFSKSPTENSTVAKQNMLYQLLMARMSDKETLASRVTPGGFIDASAEAKVMRFATFLGGNNYKALRHEALTSNYDPEPNYDITEPMTWITYNNLNGIAGKLIGVFANHNTNHALMSVLDEFKIDEDKGFKFGNLLKATATKIRVSERGESVDVPVTIGEALNADRVVYEDGRIISPANVLAQMLAASVDAVKDPVLNYLGINIYTVNVACLLARMGYSFEDIGLFLNQPVIKRLSEECATYKTRNVSKVLNRLKASYNYDENVSRIGELTIDMMYSQVTPGAEVDNLIQCAVINIFEKAIPIANEMSSIISSTKFTASNAISTNFGSLYNTIMTVASKNDPNQTEKPLIVMKSFSGDVKYPVQDGVINTKSERLNKHDYLATVEDNPFSFEQCQYDLLTRALQRIVKGRFQYETTPFKILRNKLRLLNPGYIPSEDKINSVHRDFTTMLLQNIKPSFNILNRSSNFKTIEGKDLSEELISSSEYYIYDFARDLRDFISNPENSETVNRFSFFFSKLDFSEESIGDSETPIVTVRFQGIEDFESADKNDILYAWAELAELGYATPEDNVYRRIAEGLFYYNICKYGNNFGYMTLANLCPDIIKEHINICTESGMEMSYKDFYRKITSDEGIIELMTGTDKIDENNIYYQAFFRKWCLNNLDDFSIAKTASYDQIEFIEAAASINGGVSFDLTPELMKTIPNGEITFGPVHEGEDLYYPPIIICGNKVYMANNMYFNKGEYCTYQLVKRNAITSESKRASYTFGGNLSEETYQSSLYATTETEGLLGDEVPEFFKKKEDETPDVEQTDAYSKFLQKKRAELVNDFLFETDLSKEKAEEMADDIIAMTTTTSSIESIDKEIDGLFESKLKDIKDRMNSETPIC